MATTCASVIGVPFDGYGRPGRQAGAAQVLRERGLLRAMATCREVEDLGDLDLPGGSGRRGATSLLNEAALLELTTALRRTVSRAVEDGRFPLVMGGDCSVLLGIVAGLRDASGPVGLLHVDGHEDTMPLDVSEDGEAANAEIGLLLGLTGRTLAGPLAAQLPRLEPEHLGLLGQRDHDWRARFNVASLRGLGVAGADVGEVAAEPEAATRAVLEAMGRSVDRWWLHVDLDVLDPRAFAAQGLPEVEDEPGGLTWEQLSRVVATSVAGGGCVGASIVIYDPEQDPDRRDADRIVALVERLGGALASGAAAPNR